MPHRNDTGTGTAADTGAGTRGHRSRSRSTARRRALRREVPSTVGLLTDSQDFAAMCGYRSFGFDHPADYTDYLHHVDGLLRSLSARGIHTTVVLFDPGEYAEYCGENGLDPDTSETRTRFTAELTGSGTALPYTGQPLDELVPLLVDAAVRRATWEYATAVLARAGRCADCGDDIGHASFDRAADTLERLVAGAGPGHHHFVCSIPTEEEQLVAVLHADCGGEPDTPPYIDDRESLAFVTVLAAGLALGGPGGLVMRSTTEGRGDRVHGWRLDRGRLTALSAASVFDAYCTDAGTGDLVSPEPGVEYCPGYEVDAPGPHH